MSWKTLAIVTLLLGTLTGCSQVNRLVYRIDINQGNYIDQSLVKELRFGMTKEQIEYILGPPTITDPSQPNIWYYIHWLKPGHKEPEQKNLVIELDKNGKLTDIMGDFEAGPAFYEY